MAITFVSESKGSIDMGTGNQSVSLPSSMQDGDIVFVIIICDNNISSKGPDSGQGYINVAAPITGVPGNHIDYKFMGETPDTTINIRKEGTRKQAYIIQAWRGVDSTTTLDVSLPSAATGSSSNPNPPSITPVTTGALVIAIGLLDDDESSVSVYPSGYSNTSEQNAETGGVSSATIGVASKIWTSGAEDPSAYTFADSDAWYAYSIALRPAAGEPAGFTRKIKISGTFQDKPIKTKVAGTFEDKPIKIKVGGTFQDA